jgi:2'-5' RNA ligase
MRFFISLEIPENSKEELHEAQRKIMDLVPDFQPSDPDKLHLTIAFVGEQPDHMKDPLIKVMTESTRDISPFSVTPGYIDGFPQLHTAKVIWIGVKGEIDKLFLLRHRIKDGLEKLKMDVDDRRFIPHIALGKVNNFEITPFQEREFEKIEQIDFDPIHVDSVKLFESIPDHSFHQHNTLAEIKLI